MNAASSEVVRASVLRPIAEALAAAGSPGLALLRRYGWTNPGAIDPYGLVSLARYVQFFEDAAEALKDPALGFRLGRDIEPTALGPLGVLVVNSPTLRAALGSIVAYIGALQGGTLNELAQDGDLAVFEYRIADPAVWPRRQDAEFSLVATCALVRTLIGPAWRPLEAHFEHARGPHVRALQAWFGVAPRFGESSNRLIFPAADLDRAPSGLAPAGLDIAPLFERHLSDLRLAGAPRSLSEKVSVVISRRMGKLHFSLDDVAADLGVSARTLQRDLARAGHSFGELARQCRLTRARALLGEGELSLDDIAGELGYADATAFSRAFKSWTGEPPRGRRAARR